MASQLRPTPETRDGALRRRLDHAADAVFLLDERGTVTYANQAATGLLGFPAAELLGRSPFDFAHPDDQSGAHALFAQLRQNWERPLSGVVRCRHGDGGYRDIEVIAVNRQRDPDVGAIVAHARDVTARAHALSRLEQSEDRYRALVEQLPCVAYTATLDEPTAVLYVSPQIEALLGYTPEEFRRNEGIWPEGIHREDCERVLAELRACRATGRPFASEYRFLRRDGRAVWLRDEGTVVPGTTGQPLCLHGVMQDITDRKRAERQLADAQALARVGSWEWDIVADRVTWSDEHYRIFGLEPQAHPITLPMILKQVHPADRAAVEGYAADVRRGIRRSAIEYRILCVDGSERVLEAWGKTEVDQAGRAVRMFGTVQDITERRRADETLRRTQREFRDIFELAAVGVFRSTRDGRILLANPAFARLLGYDTPAELAALDLARDVYVNSEEREALIAQYERASSSWTVELQWKKRDGTQFWVLLSAHAVLDDTGRAQYFEAFVQDITDRRRSQQELKQSRQRLQALAARLEEVREQERKVMAREIHDELGQGLTALRMDLAWLSGRLPAGAGDLTARAHRMVEVIEQTIQTVRRLATQLRPPILDDLGLIAAIEWQTEDVARRLGLRCALDLPTDLHLHEGLATTVFRILQEGLTNVARHADARSLRVALQVQDDEVVLEVVDDGRGIAPAQLENRRSLGLLGMRERAMVWGGKLDIQSPPEGGTAVVLRLPLAGASQERDTP
jgi:PAS domain S-box-containing protein